MPAFAALPPDQPGSLFVFARSAPFSRQALQSIAAGLLSSATLPTLDRTGGALSFICRHNNLLPQIT